MAKKRFTYGAIDSCHNELLNSDSSDFNIMENMVRKTIVEINTDCQIIRKLSKSIVLKNDTTQIVESINDTEKKVIENIKSVLTQLKSMSNMAKGDSDKKRRERAVVSQLTKEFNATMTQYENTIKRVKHMLERSVDQAQGQQQQIISATENNNPFGFESNEELRQERMLTDEIVQDRHAAIIELERDIQEINEIFLDLGRLIAEQGEVIDGIEDHVIDSRDRVRQGHQQIQQARIYQRSARKKKLLIACILITSFTVIVVILIIIIIIVTQMINKKKN